MNHLSARGTLSVEEMNALFEERLRVTLPGGSFKVIQQSFNSTSGSMVYDEQLPLSMLIRLQSEGRAPVIDRLPAAALKSSRTAAMHGSYTN